MGFVKLDDGFLDHQKFLEAGPLAGYLAICAIAWSNRNRTDGFIPLAQVMRLASFDGIAEAYTDEVVTDEVDARELAKALVGVGLWEEVERGYRIHDYLEHQNSAAEIHDLSTARAEAGKRGAKARWDGNGKADEKQPDSKGHGKPHGNSDGKPDGKSMANEWQKEEVRSKNPPTPLDENTSAATSLVVRRLFVHWQQQCKHEAAKLTNDRKRKVEARLREGYSEEQIRQAIDGAARSAFVNDSGKRFDDLELICRNGSKLESFLERGAGPSPFRNGMSSMDIARGLKGAS